MQAVRFLDDGSGRPGSRPLTRFVARRAGLRRTLLARLLAVLTALAGGSTGWSYQPVGYHGRVIDVDGRPVEAAAVALRTGSRLDAKAVADSLGRWSITGGHRIDAHQLLLTAPGYLALTRPDPGERSILSVLHRLPQLKGAVVDDNGAPVAGAVVVLKQPSRPVEWTVSAGDDGTFSFDGMVAPGSYQVEVTAPEHEGYLGTLDLVADGRLKVTPVVPRQLGVLVLTSNPTGQAPKLDGKPLPGCAATPCRVSIPIGSHVLSITNDLYLPWSQQLTVTDRQSLPVAAGLQRKTGTLRVATPSGGEVWIDDNLVAAGPWSGALPTGSHSVAHRSATTWPQFSTVQIGWNQDTSLNLSGGTAITPGDKAGFLAGLDAYLHAVGGQYGVYLQDLKTGADLGYHQDDVMEAASDIKVPLALYLLHQVEAGAVKMDDQVALQDSDFMGGTGSLDHSASAGDKFAVGDLLRLMIQQSDNTAWQALMRVLGASSIDAYAASIGAPDCHQVDDNCTAREAGLMLAGLYKGKLLKPDNTALLILLLENTAYNDRINYFLGGVTVAHKTGADGSVMNDVGIVYAPGGPFLISVFSQTDTGTVQPIRDVARAALRYYSTH